MTSPDQARALLAQFMRSLDALEAVSPNAYFDKIVGATSAGDLFEAMLELEYAASSKELRDTSDERIHDACRQTCKDIAAIRAWLTARFVPASTEQQERWRKTAGFSHDPDYLFRPDGSLEFGLPDSDLDGAWLTVKRVWSHLGSFRGYATAFGIELDTEQADAWRTCHVRACHMEAAMMEATAANRWPPAAAPGAPALMPEPLARLLELAKALNDIEPNGYFRAMHAAQSAGELYHVIGKFWSAASSKELRDTGNDAIHDVCEEVRLEARKLESFLVIRLFPASASQRQSWEHAFSRMKTPYRLRRDGSVRIRLLDARLEKSTLHVGRAWSDEHDYDDWIGEGDIRLDADQATYFRMKLAEARRVDAAMTALTKASRPS